MYFLLCNFCIFEWVEFRSSRPDVFCKKGVFKSLTKCTGKHMCHSLFFNKVVGLMPATLLKKRLRHRCFPVNFVKFYKHLFTQNTSGGCFCELSFLGFCHKLWSVAKVILFCSVWDEQKWCKKDFNQLKVMRNKLLKEFADGLISNHFLKLISVFYTFTDKWETN